MNKLGLIAAGALSLGAFSVNAAEVPEGGIHANDYKWFQFNIMHTIDQKPTFDGQDYKDTYLEMEFGGRSGLFDLYGYVDVFDITDSSSSSKHETGGLFMKFAPRMSLDYLFNKDLSVGPVQEWYVSSLNNFDTDLQEHFIGVGADVNVPWLGKTGMNLYARYSAKNFDNEDEGSFNGYQFSMNWFKPFYFLDNGSFVSFQGYWDHLFGASDYSDQDGRVSSGGAAFFGIYWHSDRFALGYGAKYFYDVYGQEDGAFVPWTGENRDATGLGHYFSATYKF